MMGAFAVMPAFQSAIVLCLFLLPLAITDRGRQPMPKNTECMHYVEYRLLSAGLKVENLWKLVLTCNRFRQLCIQLVFEPTLFQPPGRNRRLSLSSVPG